MPVSVCFVLDDQPTHTPYTSCVFAIFHKSKGNVGRTIQTTKARRRNPAGLVVWRGRRALMRNIVTRIVPTGMSNWGKSPGVQAAQRAATRPGRPGTVTPPEGAPRRAPR
ncbi:hypothetical protein MCP1_300037 [Candidatus Terasakiella magnetica]|nr:hypothetical protein MCP1_300037 [Candidatus Terasakiella magnetica]